MKPQMAGYRRACFAMALFCGGAMGVGPLGAAPHFVEATLPMDPPNGARDLCGRYPWACAKRSVGVVRPQSEELALVEQVNRHINSTVRPMSDRRQYGLTDYWALPTEAGGDCEDFALLKKKELIRLGVDPGRLLLATALDRRRTPHAVLIYRTPTGDLMLDSLMDEVIDWRESKYIFLKIQYPSDPRRWGGGIRQD